MNRYYTNGIKKEKDGREVYKPKIYPNIPLMDTDVYVATETGDRLDTLAHQFYGDSTLGWLIASANNIHNASFGLVDGTVLRIPKDISQILTQL
jgi:phage tail protein X